MKPTMIFKSVPFPCLQGNFTQLWIAFVQPDEDMGIKKQHYSAFQTISNGGNQIVFALYFPFVQAKDRCWMSSIRL